MLFEPYVRFRIISSVRVTEWPPIGGIAAHSAYDVSSLEIIDIGKTGWLWLPVLPISIIFKLKTSR